MSLADFYLVCFLLGFGLSAVALLAGSVHLHLPGLDVHHGIHMPHMDAAHVATDLPWFNFGTLAAFLTWFGGTGRPCCRKARKCLICRPVPFARASVLSCSSSSDSGSR
jgi:hypothetical protein